MSVYIRPKVPGASVFFTVLLVDRGADTLVRHVDVLRDAVRVARSKRPFEIDAWVVLPDHMHCVWTLPEGDADYSGRWREIKGQFSMALRRSGRAPTLLPTEGQNSSIQNPYGARGGRDRVGARPDLRKSEVAIWQKRFYEHHIRDARDYDAHVRYCWLNPVKRGFVERPKDWPYSPVSAGTGWVSRGVPRRLRWLGLGGESRGTPRPTLGYAFLLSRKS